MVETAYLVFLHAVMQADGPLTIDEMKRLDPMARRWLRRGLRGKLLQQVRGERASRVYLYRMTLLGKSLAPISRRVLDVG